MKPLQARAVAIVAISRGWCGGGLRVWGRAGKALAQILGVRAGARGSVFLNEWVVVAALVHVRERGWRGVVKLVETFPDLLYPLSPERAKKLYLKMPWWTARAVVRAYAGRYRESRIARLYRRLRRARARMAAAGVVNQPRLDEIEEWAAYACGLTMSEAEQLVEQLRDDIEACMGDHECIRRVVLEACRSIV